MKISIIGVGYVGLVTGLCFAEKGHKVIAYDINKKIVDKINDKNLTIYEPKLKKILNKNINKNFYCTNNLQSAIFNSEITFVAVPTPYTNKGFDLKYIRLASVNIAKILNIKNNKHLVVFKSTILPDTCDKIIIPLFKKKLKKQIYKKTSFAFNPEFLREGSAVNDFMYPDRLVIGANNKKTFSLLKDVYSSFNFDNIFTTNIKTAEMIKYASNAFFANLISFSNEIANLSSTLENVDSKDVIYGLKLDNRFYTKIKNNLIYPNLISYLDSGPGFGGSCFPKDLKAIVQFGKTKGNKMHLLNSVLEVNKNQHKEIIKTLKNRFNNLKKIKISILGLSFKPDTDDIRESQSLKLIKTSRNLFKQIKIFDPIVKLESKFIKNYDLHNCNSLKEAITDVDVIIIMTNWNIFKKLTILINKSSKKYIFDTRRMFTKDKFKNYLSIGMK